jgi:hypothetical protein
MTEVVHHAAAELARPLELGSPIGLNSSAPAKWRNNTTDESNLLHVERCDQFNTTLFAGSLGRMFASMCAFQFGLSEYTKSTRRRAQPIHQLQATA